MRPVKQIVSSAQVSRGTKAEGKKRKASTSPPRGRQSASSSQASSRDPSPMTGSRNFQTQKPAGSQLGDPSLAGKSLPSRSAASESSDRRSGRDIPELLRPGMDFAASANCGFCKESHPVTAVCVAYLERYLEYRKGSETPPCKDASGGQ